jgi:hypothetical protein
MSLKVITNAFHAASGDEITPHGGLALDNIQRFMAIKGYMPLSVVGSIVGAAVLERTRTPGHQTFSIPTMNL